jgi:hypothetical protein
MMSDKQPSEKYIRETIELILSGESHRLHREHIWLESAWPFMIEALRDPRADQPIDNTGKTFAGEVLHKLSCLTPIPFDLTLRFINSPSCGLTALHSIGRSATTLGGEYLGQMLVSSDEEQSKQAVKILNRSNCQHPGEPGFLKAVWQQVHKLLQNKPEQDHSRLFFNLVKLDRESTFAMLDEHKFFRANNPGLSPFLRDAKYQRLNLGVERLSALVDSLFRHRRTPPNGLCLMYALPCLAREAPKAAKPWVQQLDVQDGEDAIETVLESRLLIERLDESSLPELPDDSPKKIRKIHKVHRNYLLAQNLDTLVPGDGFFEFFTGYAQCAEQTVDALRAIGAAPQAELLSAAIDVLKDAEDISSVLHQPELMASLNTLDAQYINLDSTPVTYLLMQYQLKHKRRFKSKVL